MAHVRWLSGLGVVRQRLMHASANPTATHCAATHFPLLRYIARCMPLSLMRLRNNSFLRKLQHSLDQVGGVVPDVAGHCSLLVC